MRAMQSGWVRTVAVLTLLFGAGMSSSQDQPQKITVPLSRPGEPMSLKIDLRAARIEVIGEERPDVELSTTRSGGERRIVTPSGTRTLPGGSYELEVKEEDNSVTVDTDWREGTFAIIARVPRRANLNLSTNQGGEIRVRDIVGNLQTESMGGTTTATNINGSVIAESVNHAITLSLAGISNNGATALSSLNGDINLTLPSNAAAEFRIDTAKGQVDSEFEMDVKPGKPVIERSARDGRNDRRNDLSVRVEDVIVATINGGGPVIRIKTLNGNIRIRKAAK